MLNWLNSATQPLHIDAVAPPRADGLIGMTLCPGKKDPYALVGDRDRDLAADLQAIGEWGATTIVSLIEEHEFTLLGVPDFAAQVSAHFRWHWLPMPDGGVPDAGFEERWAVAGPQLHGQLVAGDRVLLHCRAGLGRTGIVVARLLFEFGMTPMEALRAVRAARPGTVETALQQHYVLQRMAGGRGARPVRNDQR